MSLLANNLQYHTGGKLFFFKEVWYDFAPGLARTQLDPGHFPIWDAAPPPTVDMGVRRTTSPSEQAALDSELLDLLQHKCIEPVPGNQPPPGSITARVFVVPKRKKGQWRLICDLRPLNKFVKFQHFKMESLKDVRALMNDSDWAVTLDLSKAFHHAPLHPRARKYFQFWWRGRLWRYTCLPFGYTASPRLWTKLLRPILRQLRHVHGVRAVIYIDDLILLAPRHLIQQHRDLALQLMLAAGLTVNWDKSCLRPTRYIPYLGVEVDLPNQQLVLPKKKVKLYSASITRALNAHRAASGVSCKLIEVLLGQLNACSDCVSDTPLFLNNLKNDLRAASLDSPRMSLSEATVRDLRFWRDTMLVEWNGRSVKKPRASVQIYSDASDTRWGCHFVVKGRAVTKGAAFAGDALHAHINLKEAMAVIEALQQRDAIDSLRGKAIDAFIDNLVVVFCINSGKSRSPALQALLLRLHNWLRDHGVLALTAHYVPTELNPADDPSRRTRRVSLNDLQLHQGVFDLLLKTICLQPGIDLFATADNRLLERFVSWKYHPQAVGTDVFSQPLPCNELLWAHPPVGLVPRLLQKLKREQCLVLVMTPLWPAQTWWPTLLQMAVFPPVILPQIPNLRLSGPQQDCPAPVSWCSVVTLICGEPSMIPRSVLRRLGPFGMTTGTLRAGKAALLRLCNAWRSHGPSSEERSAATLLHSTRCLKSAWSRLRVASGSDS